METDLKLSVSMPEPACFPSVLDIMIQQWDQRPGARVRADSTGVLTFM